MFSPPHSSVQYSIQTEETASAMPKVGYHWSFPQESTGWVVLKPPRMKQTQTAQSVDTIKKNM